MLELPLDPLPMFGQWCFVGEVDFGVVEFGAVLVVDAAGVEVVGVVDVELLGADEELVGAAAAPAMPAAAPAVASTPAIIVALSILETCIVVVPPLEGVGGVDHHVCRG